MTLTDSVSRVETQLWHQVPTAVDAVAADDGIARDSLDTHDHSQTNINEKFIKDAVNFSCAVRSSLGVGSGGVSGTPFSARIFADCMCSR